MVATFQVLNFRLHSNCSKCIALGTLCSGEFKDVMSYARWEGSLRLLDLQGQNESLRLLDPQGQNECLGLVDPQGQNEALHHSSAINRHCTQGGDWNNTGCRTEH